MAKPSWDEMLKATPAGPPPAGVQSNFVDPPSQKETIYGISIAFVILSSIFVVLRAVTRLAFVRTIGFDDYTILLAQICSIILSITICEAANYGSGRHVWDVTLWDLQIGAKWGMAATVFYCLAIGLVKVSLAACYVRFVTQRGYRIVIYVVMGIAVSYTTASVLVNIFTCDPIKKAWDISIKDGYCIDKPSFYFANAGLNIATDIILLVLPVPILWSLHMAKAQRICLILVFLVGIFVCISSIIRLVYLVPLQTSTDPTWDTAAAGNWCIIEVNVAICCACVPTLRPLAKKYLPNLSSGSRSSRRQDQQGSSWEPAYHKGSSLLPSTTNESSVKETTHF